MQFIISGSLHPGCHSPCCAWFTTIFCGLLGYFVNGPLFSNSTKSCWEGTGVLFMDALMVYFDPFTPFEISLVCWS